MKKYIIQAFDIETSGPNIVLHNLLAVGIVTYEFSNNGCKFIDSLEVHIDGDIVYDNSTKEFWNKNQDAFDNIMLNREDPSVCASKIINYLTKWQKCAIDKNINYRIITDNCWFDDTWLSYFLCKHNGQPLRYNYHTGYMKTDNVIDINQRVQAIKSDCCIDINLYIQNKTPHDHTPVSDAKGIVEKYYTYLSATKPYRKKI